MSNLDEENSSNVIDLSKIKEVSASSTASENDNWINLNKSNSANRSLKREIDVARIYSEAFETINDKLIKLQMDLVNKATEIKTLEENFKVQIKENKEDYQNKIDQSNTRSIEILGLFVALFTFVSVEFSLLNKVEKFNELLSLSLILGSVLLGFVFAIDYIIHPTKKRLDRRLIVLFGVCTVFFILGLIFKFVEAGGEFNIIKQEIVVTDKPGISEEKISSDTGKLAQ